MKNQVGAGLGAGQGKRLVPTKSAQERALAHRLMADWLTEGLFYETASLPANYITPTIRKVAQSEIKRQRRLVAKFEEKYGVFAHL